MTDELKDALRSAGERVRNALRLAKNWIEHDEGRTLEQILAIEARGKEHGVSAFNPEFMAACIAIDAAIRALPVPGEVNAAIPDVLFDGHTVLQALDDKAKRRTSAENVSDTLDAIVRLLRPTPAAAKGGEA